MPEKLNWASYDKDVEANRKFYKLKNGATTLDLSDWVLGDVMGKQGLKFNLMSVNDEAITGKVFETSSLRLIKKLRPVIDKADAEGKTMITVKITAVGDGFDRQFEVAEV